MAGDLDGDNSDEKQPPFRWLEAARYALAMVMTVLIVAVIVNAIKVLLRPDFLSLTVLGGSVFCRRSSNASVVLNFNLTVQNPSGRSRLYFVGITVYLFDQNTPPWTSNPIDDSIAYFSKQDTAVGHEATVESFISLEVTADSMSKNLYFIFKTLYDGGTIPDVTMRVDGRVITEVISGLNTSTRPTTYYCPQLLLGGDKSRQDVPCTLQGGAGPAA